MKKNFILGLTILGFIFSLHTLTSAKWITLSLDGKMAYDDNHIAKDTDPGPTFSQSYNLTYEFPFITESALKGTLNVTDNNTISSDSRNFRLSANVAGSLYSLQASRSEETREETVGGGTVSTRNDFSASFTPKEKYLPQLRYTFNESDSDLSGAANTLDFKLSQNFKPGDKISFDFAYALTKTTNIISDQETQDQKINFKINSNPFSNIRFSFGKDYGINENLASVDPQTENLRTSYDLIVTPFSNVNLGWRRSEDFSSSSGLLNVSTGKNIGLTLKPFDKIDIKYDYTLTEDEKEIDVTSNDNTGQNLTVSIPIKFNIDLRYIYTMRKNADTLGYGTSSEDNGFNIGYKSPMINGNNFTLNFSLDTDARSSSTADADTKQQNTVNFGLDGRASIIKMLDFTFSHRDSVTKSNTYIDDQESITDSYGASLRYSIAQLINGNVDMRFNSRESNAHSGSTKNSDRTLSNKLDYKTGDLSLGISFTFSENETDENVTSKKNIAPTLSYSLTKGKVSFRYSLNDRVDEDPITGELSSSRDTNYDFGFNYSVAQNATLDLKYSARNHIDFKESGNNDDSDRISTGLNFKF